MKKCAKAVLAILLWTLLSMVSAMCIAHFVNGGVVVSGLIGMLCGIAVLYPILKQMDRCFG